MIHFSSDHSTELLDTATALLARARKKGVVLWCDNGRLHCKAPKGALTDDDVHSLTAHRDQIIARLEMAIGVEVNARDLVPRARPERVPLTFTQLAHWHRYHLATRRHMRQIASATRLQGPLRLEALRASIAEVFRRHEALRTRPVLSDGIAAQTISEPAEFVLEIDQLPASINGSREREVEQWIVRHAAEEIDVARDPLFSIRLLKEGDDQHLLLVAMDHMISDGVSGNIVLQEIMTAYAQAAKGLAISLPPMSVQLADYALWQQDVERSWIARRAAYWTRRLAGCQPVQFPSSDRPRQEGRRGWGTAPIRIDSGLKMALTALSRRRRTTLVMSVLAAYTALLMRWCNVSDIVVPYVTDGRMVRQVENSVGYFAFSLYLRMTLPESTTFSGLMQQVAAEYSAAHEYADFGYADALEPERGFTRNSAFNWVPQASNAETPENDATSRALTYSTVFFEHPVLEVLELDREPLLVLYDTKSDVRGGIHFPRERFTDDTMVRFADNFIGFLKALLIRPESRVMDVPLV
jgi:hypothetical protein